MDKLQVWRDLYWLIHSADLLSDNAGLPLATWPAPALQNADRWLAQERLSPEHLVPGFTDGYRRLGLYAEALLGMALQHNTAVELLASHTPLHIAAAPPDDAGHPDTPPARRTIGELDYVWRDRLTRQVWHWELAVKLYLFVPTLPVAAGAARFVGLQQRDTLARKTAKLRDHQLPLSSLPQVTHMLGVSVDQAAAVVKGWLFYPLQGKGWNDYAPVDSATSALLNPKHLRGWWLSYREFTERLAAEAHACREDDRSRTADGVWQRRWRVLSRMQWLSPHVATARDTLDTPALLEILRSWFDVDVFAEAGTPSGSARPRPGLLIVAMEPIAARSASAGRSFTDAASSASVEPAELWTSLDSQDSLEPIEPPESLKPLELAKTSEPTTLQRLAASAGPRNLAMPSLQYAEVHRGFVVADGWADILQADTDTRGAGGRKTTIA